jgi:hypothetical protein
LWSGSGLCLWFELVPWSWFGFGLGWWLRFALMFGVGVCALCGVFWVVVDVVVVVEVWG